MSTATVMEEFSTRSPEEVYEYLRCTLPTLSQSILETILEHKIDGETFLQLEDEDLKEIAPLLGDRIKLKRCIQTQKTSRPTVSFISYIEIKLAKLYIAVAMDCFV